MTEALKAFLNFYLPHQNIDSFLEKFRKININKGEHLLKPGMDCSFIAYIQQGTFRVYHYDKDGKEIITWFSFKGMVITDLLGFYQSGKAQFYVEALEDGILYKITKRDLEQLYLLNPNYRKFGQLFAEEALIMLMERTMSLHTKSAEARYLELIQIPDFIEKIPLKYLASYLGVTDTSLSRIRRKIY